MDAELARLAVVIDARMDKFEAQLKKANRAAYASANKMERDFNKAAGGIKGQLAGIAKSSMLGSTALGSLGAAGLGATAALAGLSFAANQTMAAMEWGDTLDAQATKLRISAERLQELQFMAEETDVPIDTLHSSLEKMNEALGALKLGQGDAKIKKFAALLGIDKESLKDVDDATELLPILADRIKAVKSTAEQARIAKAFGAAELLPLLREGSDGIARMTEEYRKLGIQLDNKTVTALADANREMEISGGIIKANLRGAFAGLAVDIAKSTTALVEFLTWMKNIEAKAPGLAKAIDIARKAGALTTPAGAVRGIWEQFGPKTHRRTVVPGFSGPGIPQAVLDYARAHKPPVAAVPEIDTTAASKAAGGRSRSARADDAAKRAAEDLARLLADHADKIVEDGSESFRKYVDDFEKTVIKPDGNPDLRDPPPDVVSVGRWVMSPEEAEDLKGQFKDTARGALEALRTGGAEGLWAWAGERLADSLLDGASDALAELAMQFLNAMKAGGEGGGAGSGFGGLWSAAGTAASTVFGGPKFARGTDYAPGGVAMVGERGRELVNLPRGAQVIPNDILRALSSGSLSGLRGGRGGGVVQYITLQAPNAILGNELMDQIQRVGAQAQVGGAVGGAAIAERQVPAEAQRRASMRLGGGRRY